MTSSDVAAAQEALKVADLVLENEGLKLDVDELIELRQEEEQALAYAEAEVAHLETDYEEQAEEVALLEEEVDDLHDLKEEHVQELEGLRADVDEQRAELEDAQNDFDELTDIYQDKAEDLKMAEEDIKELKETLAGTEAKLKANQLELAQAFGRIALLEGENRRLKTSAAAAPNNVKEAAKAKVADKENGGAQSPALRKLDAKKGLKSPLPMSRLALPAL